MKSRWAVREPRRCSPGGRCLTGRATSRTGWRTKHARDADRAGTGARVERTALPARDPPNEPDSPPTLRAGKDKGDTDDRDCHRVKHRQRDLARQSLRRRQTLERQRKLAGSRVGSFSSYAWREPPGATALRCPSSRAGTLSAVPTPPPPRGGPMNAFERWDKIGNALAGI